MEALAILFLATLVATSHATDVGRGGLPLPIHLLRPLTGSGDLHLHGISCVSWRLAVETNNIRDWKTVPRSCENYVGHYMLGDRYRKDSKVVADEAASYAANLTLNGDGKEIWVFDIDETVLSNIPYYAKHGFGTNERAAIEVLCLMYEQRIQIPQQRDGRFGHNTYLMLGPTKLDDITVPATSLACGTPTNPVPVLWAEVFNSTKFNAWAELGEAPPLPESLKLYKKLLSLGIKVVFLTGRREARRKSTEKNLKIAGFHTWEKVILRQPEEEGNAVVFKSGKRKQLEAQGYIIVGNMGDQWSDILGTPTGLRTFKVPDPMYYIS